MGYKHLSLEERYYLETGKKAGKTLTEIAADMNRSQSTLSRELIRNTGKRGYRHKQAMRLAQERHTIKPKQVKLTEGVKKVMGSKVMGSGLEITVFDCLTEGEIVDAKNLCNLIQTISVFNVGFSDQLVSSVF